MARGAVRTWRQCCLPSAFLRGEPIDVYNQGHHRRDFTYIDDIVDGVLRVLDSAPTAGADPASGAPCRLYNIGNDAPVELLRFIELLEHALDRQVKKRLLPMQPGDVEATWADVEPLRRDTGWTPSTAIEEGVARFAVWYRDYHRA